MLKTKPKKKLKKRTFQQPFSEQKIQPNEALKLLCQKSFYYFVKTFWHTVVPEVPVWNWHIKHFCDKLQRIAERVMRGEPKENDYVCNVPPGTTKSTVFSIMFPAWVWTRMPSARFICGSYADVLSLDLSRKCRDLVKSELYSSIFPEVQIKQDQDVKTYFANTRGGMRYAVGTGGSVIGMHAHFLIVDDPIDPMKVLSEQELKEVNRWMTQQLSQRKVDKAVSVLILVMQRLHQDDPSANLLNRGGVDHTCFPAEIADDKDRDKVRPVDCIRFYKNGLLDPVRLSPTVLANALKELGEYGYAGQYRQNPVPPGGNLFDADKFVIRPEAPKLKRIVSAWDKAASMSLRGAYTVNVKMGISYDNEFWITRVIRQRWTSHEREKNILAMARFDGKTVEIELEQEGGSGGKESAENTARMLRGFIVRVNKPSSKDDSKIDRADAYSAQVNTGNVYLVQASWNDTFIDEHRFFPFSKFKDQVDAASACFNRLSKRKLEVGAL